MTGLSRYYKTPVHLEFGDEARQSLVRGAMTLAKAVGCTLGPGGRCVHIDRGIDTLSTRDGVTVAKAACDLVDPRERMGARLLADAAEKVANECGDGTTTTVVIASKLLQEAFKLVSAGVDPCLLAGQIRAAAVAAHAHLMEASRPMAEADIRTVAAAASKDDERVIVPVLSAYAHVGVQGTVVLRDSDSGRTEIVTEEGYRIDKGWTDLGFAMMTDRLVLDKCFVALTPRHISHAATIVPLMQFAAEAECSLLLIAHQIGGSAQQTLLGNHRNNALHCCSVIAPSFHHLQRGYLDDMAAWTGGRVMDLDGDLPTDGLGYVDKAIITKERTVLICEENLVQNRVDSRINYLTGLLGKLDNEYDIDKVKQRIGRLRGRLAEIRAGAATDSERSELKHRIEDAIGAVRVAWQDGLLQGAGASLVQAAAKIDLRASYGAAALVRAMEEPCRKLHENAGKDGSVATAAFRSGASTTHVLDPTKVVCCALSAAVSTVTTLLLCEGSMVYRHDLRRRG